MEVTSGVGTLEFSERALGYSEPAKLLTPEGAPARLRGVGITKSTWVRRVLRPNPVNRLCTPHSGFAYTIRLLHVADQFQFFGRIVTGLAKLVSRDAPRIERISL